MKFCKKCNTKEYHKKYYSENKEELSDYLKKWFNNNPDKRKEYYENLRLNNQHIIAWRSVLKSAIKRINTKKSDSTIQMLGYSSNDLKLHLESLFIDDMSCDKETPMSIVNNLQPLWALDNLSKSNKLEND